MESIHFNNDDHKTNNNLKGHVVRGTSGHDCAAHSEKPRSRARTTAPRRPTLGGGSPSVKRFFSGPGPAPRPAARTGTRCPTRARPRPRLRTKSGRTAPPGGGAGRCALSRAGRAGSWGPGDWSTGREGGWHPGKGGRENPKGQSRGTVWPSPLAACRARARGACGSLLPYGAVMMMYVTVKVIIR